MSIPYRGGKGPLNLLIPSQETLRNTLPGSGQHRHQGQEGEGEWDARKHGSPKRRIWRKIHIDIDKETLSIRVLAIPDYTALGVPVTQPME